MPSGIYVRRKGKHGRPKGIPSKFKKVKRVQTRITYRHWREVGITLRDTVIGSPYLTVEQGIASPKTSDEVLDVMEFT
jgi:hypothetical protein